jgi:hypothetical protein
MFDLAILERTAAPPVPGEDEPGVDVWRDLGGAVCAVGFTRDGRHWMDVPGVASYAFGAGSRTVDAMPHSGGRPDLVREAFERTVLPIVLQALGTEVLHASAVLSRCGVVAFCAVSETGKSTFAYALGRRGYAQWADDAVAFEARGEGAVALPLPFSPRLHDDAVSALGAADAARAAGPGADGPVPIAAVALLVRSDESDDTRVDRLSPTAAFPRVLEHGHCFSLDDEERKRRMLAQYLDLVSAVPTLVVTYPSGFDRLPATLDVVSEAIEATCRESDAAPRRG